jgi:succinoglycan biosynthesis protein ExoV
MKMFRFTDGLRGNFGDDLNRWMWKRLIDCPLDQEDGMLVLGIGTVISRKFIPARERYIVMSSGVGYDAPPEDFGDSRWTVLSVRGPLTAEALGLPPETAIIDGAALLRLLPECEPLPEDQRAGIAFMPHYESLHTGNWEEVCKMAGFEFLDPREDSEVTVQRIRKSKLVIADAMHAAIVADSLRVPWIPVVTSPQSSTFKWLDWTLSLELPYCPVELPASTWLESCRRNSFRFYGQDFYLKNSTPEKAIRHYRRVRQIESWAFTTGLRLHAVHLTWSLPKKIISSRILSNRKREEDERRTHLAVDSLARVAEGRSYLSSDSTFNNRLAKMTLLLRQLEELPRPQVDSIPPKDRVSERGPLLEDYSCDLFCK